MMRLLRCVLFVGVFVFTSKMCRALSLYNAMTEDKELVTCIFFTERQALESCDFTPSEFFFGTTGVVYRARFRPRHALPHGVRVSYTGDARIRWAGAERAAAGFSARVVIWHGRTAWEFPPQDRMPIVRLNSLLETLFVFRVGDFDWRYDDEIELTLEVLSPVPQDSCLRAVKPKLTVHELPYLF